MNELLLALGVSHWKPVIGILLLPPVPLLLLVLIGARLLPNHRLMGWLLTVLACAGLWWTSTAAAGHQLRHWFLHAPAVLSPADIATLRGSPLTAIVVLGGGRSPMALEYGTAQLHARGVERLRYGIFLARQTALPLAFSGGTGWGAADGPAEATLAARLARTEFNFKLRWTEDQSRDTRENSTRSVALLREQGVRHIVLVTHDYHMPRAARAFLDAINAGGVPIQLTLAPMGVSPDGTLRAMDWLPSLNGIQDTRLVLHEWLGRLGGA
jgi:uncharacterized SAM-binding protein YcdF (DUF218 family)